MQDYNVLVTFHHNDKAQAEEEVANRLKEAGVVLEDMMESRVPGLLHLRVSGDGKEAVKKLRGFAFRFPELFRFTHRWTPVEEWVLSTPDAMLSAARVFGSRIGRDESWRMDVEKRSYQGGSTLDIVKMLTDPIDHGKVVLDNPEKVIKVEIIGDYAGFSVVEEEEVLDINKVRAERGLAKIF